MNRICLIYPYFGKFPNYFNLFINSANHNKNIDFHFYTDISNTSKYASDNIFFHYDTLENIKHRIESYFKTSIILSNPYKLCDYKPIYNYIFDVCKNYEFWGFGDIDIILGDTSKFINNAILDSKLVIGHYGHLMIIKNNRFVYEIFEKETKDLIKDVFATPYNIGFDEWDYSYLNVLKKYNSNYVYDIFDCFADIKVQNLKGENFEFSNNPLRKQMQGKQIYEYKNGKLIGHFLNCNNYYIENILYIHLQKRKMKVKNTDVKCTPNPGQN